ncbi:hypothetical protein J6590_089360 [Homalodisca vitripennis]|nr:hypothetical protein J6590_089360 [Homalodisca vitripennis]
MEERRVGVQSVSRVSSDEQWPRQSWANRHYYDKRDFDRLPLYPPQPGKYKKPPVFKLYPLPNKDAQRHGG